MSFHDSADKFSFALSWLVHQHMSVAFARSYEIDQESWNKALSDAHQSLTELESMGQHSVISTSFWSVANATYFFSPLESFEEHQDMLDQVFEAVANFGDASNSDEEETESSSDFIEDDIYGDVDPDHLEHLKNCFNLQYSA